jgi:hypothetical protein
LSNGFCVTFIARKYIGGAAEKFLNHLTFISA